MICKFCGMDSATSDVCSWCGKSLAAPEPEALSAGDASPIVETSADTVNLDLESAVAPRSLPTASAPASPTALTGGNASSPAPSAAPRKFAPAVPPPSSQSRPRTPAPGTLPPAARPVTTSAPLTGSVPVAPANFSLTGEQASAATPETLIGSVPPSASPAPDMTPSLLEQADALATPPSISGSEHIAARPLQPPSSTQESPPTAIGTGVSPAWTSNTPSVAPAAATMPDEAQRKAAVDAALLDSGPSPLQLLLRYVGAFALILIVMGGVAFIAKPLYVIPMLIAMFVGALLLPVMRVSPWPDEDSDDLVWFVLLTLLFGPLVALIIYGTVAVLRQEFNASILGCLAVAALARIVGEVATSGMPIVRQMLVVTSPFTTFRHIDAHLVEMLLLDWSGFAALAGWYAASTFHKEDE
jgi:hypothetical protein